MSLVSPFLEHGVVHKFLALFWYISQCQPSAILDFGNSNFLTVWALNRPILHNHAKFRKDLSIRCDIAICVVFKMTTAAILFFEKFEILMVCPLLGANLRHRAKFHQNRSNGCGDMAI